MKRAKGIIQQEGKFTTSQKVLFLGGHVENGICNICQCIDPEFEGFESMDTHQFADLGLVQNQTILRNFSQKRSLG